MLQLGDAAGVHPSHANRRDDQDHDEYHDYDHVQDQRVAFKLCQNSVTLGHTG